MKKILLILGFVIGAWTAACADVRVDADAEPGNIGVPSECEDVML